MISQNNNINSDESIKDNNNFLYVINKDWIINAKMFLEYLMKLNNNIEIDYLFDLDLVYDNYFNAKDNYEKKRSIYNIYPGPINNFYITSFNDHWEDNNNLDENDFIKKDVKLNEDYILVNYKDWEFLKSVFDCTNEIKRKKGNLDLIKIKYVLFDRRLQSNKHITLVKERNIQINRNSTIKQLKNKIINCINQYFKKCEENQIIRKQEIYFYILNKNKTHILFEMVYSFYILVEPYESLYIEKLDFVDNSNLSQFFEKYDKSKHILVIELINDDDNPNFLVELKMSDNKYKCMKCKKEIKNINAKYNCSLCNYSLFCSKTCVNTTKI